MVHGCSVAEADICLSLCNSDTYNGSVAAIVGCGVADNTDPGTI